MSSAYSLAPLQDEGLDVQSTSANNFLRLVCWLGILGVTGSVIKKKHALYKKQADKLTNMDNFDLLETEVKRKMVVHGGLKGPSALFLLAVVLVMSINVFLST